MKILVEKAVIEQALGALESKLGETHPFAHDLEKATAIRALREALAKQAEKEPVLYPIRRGSRITCIESGEKCIVWATSHTDCWVQFPDGHAGQYTYEQIGKYFSIEENQAADEAYERGSKEGIEAGKKIVEQAEQEPVAIGSEWKPCMKLPVVVHVREQREGESHVSTREGITPVRPDDLIMRGVAGEEYPIGRELFNKTYTFDTAAPVRIKDLTDDEISRLWYDSSYGDSGIDFARAAIAKDREKNK